MSSVNNKRIAKNTLFLYGRMLIVMLISLFTVRIVLNALGAEDYGINNVVGGVVAMFAFLTSTMTSASQRFFSYALGQKNFVKLSQYFCITFWCYVGLIVFIVVLSETLGLWFVKNKLTIPHVRMNAAMWVYQFAICSFVISIICIPFNSIIIAREMMSIYAYAGIAEAFLKLLVAFLLYVSPTDKLISYSALMFLMNAIVYGFYIIYGLRRFDECKIRLYWNSSTFKEVISYSAWSLFGAISGVIRSQGINILLNVFFNPIVNAARAIAFQINTSINYFVINFYKAVQPQIVKTYAANEQDSFSNLVFRSSRFCFYLIIFVSIPVLIETPIILSLWLKKVPDYTILFTRLVIITAIIDSTQYPLQTCISATGKIKLFQIVTGSLLILNLPISWFFLRNGYPPQATMYVAIGISLVAQATRIYFAKLYANISVRAYMFTVFFRIALVFLFSISLPLWFFHIFIEGFSRFFIIIFTSFFWTGFIIWLGGITSQERKTIKLLLIRRFHAFRNC